MTNVLVYIEDKIEVDDLWNMQADIDKNERIQELFNKMKK